MTRTITKTPPPPPQEEKPFYGWRYINRVRPDGTVEVERVLLTLEDVLHPQEDDVIPENSLHEADRRYLSDTFHARQSRLEHGLVLSDCLVDWGVEGLGNHSPDISVFAGVKVRPPEPIGTFRLRASGGHCLTIIELVSPHTRTTDVDSKPEEYHRAKIPLYVMVDQKKEGGPRQLRVFRYTPEKYEEERPETVWLKALGLRLGLKDNRVVCFDADTGEELGDYTQQQLAFQAAEQARQTAEKARQAAEQARALAEKHAQEQALGRQAAEQARQAAEQARESAEKQAHEQTLARQAADQRVRELEALLQQRDQGKASETGTDP